MSLESQFTLSFYKEVTTINEKHQVILVQHVETHKLYVKKIVAPHNLEIYRILKSVRFASIPAIVELVEEDDCLIVIEEYINGQSLEEILTQRLFSEEETRRILIDLCQILKPLHQYDPPIIHRDIKPSNLILDNQNHLFLIDFDASKSYDPEKSRDTVLMGTEDYAAPEQYGFLQSSDKTDIFSIGVLANKMLTGMLPSEKRTTGPFSAIVSKCLAIDPRDRFSSISDLSSAIAKTGQSTSALSGFHKKSLKNIVISVVWYCFICLFAFTLQVSDKDGLPLTGFLLYLNRFAIASVFILWTLYFTNYRNFRHRFPFRKRENIFVNLLRIAVGAFLLLAIPACVVAMAESLLF